MKSFTGRSTCPSAVQESVSGSERYHDFSIILHSAPGTWVKSGGFTFVSSGHYMSKSNISVIGFILWEHLETKSFPSAT